MVATYNGDTTPTLMTIENWLARPRTQLKPYTGTDDLIAEFKETGKAKNTGLIRALAIAKAESEFLELDHVRLPYEILDIAAAKLVGGPKWAREQAKLRKEQRPAQHRHKQWQTLADTIRSKNPRLTNEAVARQIARQIGGNADWIRRVIVRSK